MGDSKKSKSALGYSLGWLRAMTIGLIMFALTLLGATWWMFYTAGERASVGLDSIQPTIPYVEIEKVNLKDTVAVEKLLNTICNNHAYLAMRQETLINDIRQETNNNLDKMDRLLSFWVGMLAIFGVLAPLVAEYRHRIDMRGEMDNIKAEAQEYKAEIERTMAKYKALIARFELEDWIYGVSLMRDERMLDDMSGKSRLMGILMDRLLCSLGKFLDEMDPRAEGAVKGDVKGATTDDVPDMKSQRALLLRSLISLLSLTQMLRLSAEHIHVRKLDKCAGEIKELIDELSARSYMNDIEAEIAKIKRLLETLSAINR